MDCVSFTPADLEAFMAAVVLPVFWGVFASMVCVQFLLPVAGDMLRDLYGWVMRRRQEREGF